MNEETSVQESEEQLAVLEEVLEEEDQDEYDDSMDGDHESALTSAGYGEDESYGYFGENDCLDGE